MVGGGVDEEVDKVELLAADAAARAGDTQVLDDAGGTG